MNTIFMTCDRVEVNHDDFYDGNATKYRFSSPYGKLSYKTNDKSHYFNIGDAIEVTIKSLKEKSNASNTGNVKRL